MSYSTMLPQIGIKLAEEIDEEIARARKKFPGNQHLNVALMEEVGELAQAQLQRKPREEIRAEAIQVCCVAIRIIQEMDADLENDNTTVEQLQKSIVELEADYIKAFDTAQVFWLGYVANVEVKVRNASFVVEVDKTQVCAALGLDTLNGVFEPELHRGAVKAAMPMLIVNIRNHQFVY
jgi:NTP pyrophosphatase (non-canonical NTP hydrolase)